MLSDFNAKLNPNKNIMPLKEKNVQHTAPVAGFGAGVLSGVVLGR
jgi:hypothetical protein